MRPLAERFWEKVEKQADGCWRWTGAQRQSFGYGTFSVKKGKNVSAHRMAYELTHGPIPNGMLVLHGCDNPRCVNPSHLMLGDQSNNIKDCVERGRHVPPTGTRNGMSKLSDSDVQAIRRAKRGGEKQYAIAARFGVSQATVSMILKGNRWGKLQESQ